MAVAKIISKYSNNTSAILNICTIDTPVGELSAAADDDHLYLVCFEDSKNYEKHFENLAKQLSCKFMENKNKLLQMFECELSQYFAGKLKKFTIPIKLFGSDFQKSVWEKLQELPFGTTQTYGDLAKSLGREASHSRAVGAACGANPLLLVIPCHRLVASGAKGGFSCGIDRKDKLIEHEIKNA